MGEIGNGEKKDIDCTVNVLDTFFLLQSAWAKVSQEVISNCYHHAGFKVAMQEEEHSNESESNQDTILQPHNFVNEGLRHDFGNIFDRITAVFDGSSIVTADDYLTVDENVQTVSGIDDACIIESLKGPTPTDNAVEIVDDGDDNTELRAPPPKHGDVRQALCVIRSFLQSSKEGHQYYDALQDIKLFTTSAFIRTSVQKKVTDFFPAQLLN